MSRHYQRSPAHPETGIDFFAALVEPCEFRGVQAGAPGAAKPADHGRGPSSRPADFALRDEVCRLMARLDTVKNGTIQHIDVQAGLTRRVVREWRLTGSL